MLITSEDCEQARSSLTLTLTLTLTPTLALALALTLALTLALALTCEHGEQAHGTREMRRGHAPPEGDLVRVRDRDRVRVRGRGRVRTRDASWARTARRRPG